MLKQLCGYNKNYNYIYIYIYIIIYIIPPQIYIYIYIYICHKCIKRKVSMYTYSSFLKHHQLFHCGSLSLPPLLPPPPLPLVIKRFSFISSNPVCSNHAVCVCVHNLGSLYPSPASLLPHWLLRHLIRLTQL